MKVLVSGATGFVGNHVIKVLLSKGHEVIGTGVHVEKAKSFDWFRKVRFIPFSLSENNADENLFQFFEKPDAMIHLAWQGLPNYKDPAHIETYLGQHSSFLSNLIRNGLKNITVAGTCLEYGMQNGCLREDMETKPANPYAIAKDHLRKFLEELKSRYDFSFKWMRLFYVYGEGQNKKSLLPLLDKAVAEGETEFKMSGGEQLRDYLPVEAVAADIVSLALIKNLNGVFNCCSGKPVSVKQLVKSYIAERNYNIEMKLGYYPYPDYEPMEFWGDNRKLKNVLEGE